MAEFWAAVLDFAEDPADPNLPEHTEWLIQSADRSQRLLFIKVPEGKSVKNRVHLDLKPAVGTRDEEVERVLGLGAVMVEDHRRSDGTGWAQMADVEGNEFCILRSDAERQS